MNGRCLALAVLLALALTSPARGGRPPTRALFPVQALPPELQDVFGAAVENPRKPEAVEPLRRLLPREGAYYIVEGDIAITDEELIQYLMRFREGHMKVSGDPELVVNEHEGRPDYYRDPADRRLTYVVDTRSFPSEHQALAVAKQLQIAAADWMNACPECGIEFREVRLDEPAMLPQGVARPFQVRYEEGRTGLIARAFFPHDSPIERILRIYPGYFNSGHDPVGVLRHELGHVLGYGHERARDVPGCFEYTLLDSADWSPHTPYDARSVMHYFCGGGGTLALELTESDRESHRRLYARTPSDGSDVRPPPPPPPPESAMLVSPAARSAAKLLEAAVASPLDEVARSAWLSMLPSHGGYYIVEGDMRMTEDEVVAYLFGLRTLETTSQVGAELAVNLHDGKPDFYASPADRRLTYAIERGTFPSEEAYVAVRQNMAAATKEWEEACVSCQIDFVEVTAPQASPAGVPPPNFVVRHVDTGGQFIAAAFFPHDAPARRLIEVDPSYFTTSFDRVGVLRHELGHVLGYRHEHVRDVAGCYREDSSWMPVTIYDPKSVMHYFCGGGGSRTLALTNLDREGHRKLYDVATPEAKALLRVIFEGGDVVKEGVKVLLLLAGLDLLPTAEHVVSERETASAVYAARLGIPERGFALRDLAATINSRVASSRPLPMGDRLKYPNVTFVPHEYGKVLDQEEDRVVLETLRRDPTGILLRQQSSGDRVRLTLRGYELIVDVRDPAKLDEVIARISRVTGPTVRATRVEPAPSAVAGAPTSKYYGHHDAKSFPKQDISTFWEARAGVVGSGFQGALGSLVGCAELPTPWGRVATAGGIPVPPCQPFYNCPEVILIDKPVSPHPDLEGLIVCRPPLPPSGVNLVNGTTQVVEESLPLPSDEHGTHLAGIIAALDNDFGLVGVHPGTLVNSWPWDYYNPGRHHELVGAIRRREEASSTNEGRTDIYVFATSWEPTTVTSPPEDALSKVLLDEDVVVVAAAGQADPPNLGIDLTETMRLAPQNLGRERNVIVVTACDPCAENAHLLPEANFSTQGLVHVAAPGKDIPGTAADGKYGVQDGTSPATAIVAGVVSAMACYYPGTFRSPALLKRRLQTTSTPMKFLGASQRDAERVATGVVNLGMAMLDPSLHWLKPSGGARVQVVPADFAWAVEDIVYTTATGGKAHLPVETILRLMIGADPASGTTMIAYVNGPEAGQVETLGPFVLSPTQAGTTVLTIGGSGYTLVQLEDVLLSKTEPFNR